MCTFIQPHNEPDNLGYGAYWSAANLNLPHGTLDTKDANLSTFHNCNFHMYTTSSAYVVKTQGRMRQGGVEVRGCGKIVYLIISGKLAPVTFSSKSRHESNCVMQGCKHAC